MLSCTLEELDLRMTSSEFTQWQVIDANEPTNMERIEAYLKLICTCIYDVNIPHDKPKTKISDFALEWKAPVDIENEKQSNLYGVLKQWAMQHNKNLKSKIDRLVKPNRDKKKKRKKKDGSSSR